MPMGTTQTKVRYERATGPAFEIIPGRGAGFTVAHVWASLRILLGAIFAWAFVDKLFGLGYATKPEAAWLSGGSPTMGYLASATGPLASFYQGIAGHVVTDVLFMAGLAAVGTALILGIGVRIAAAAGVLMMLLMWSSHPPTTNPILDDHIVYAVVLVGAALARAGETWGLGRRWTSMPFVARHRVLE
ncbi:MAG: hypothetical protein ACT4PT_11225 [Methanobacteriota archaeon]